jgi:Zn-dependent M28 family amino/carboxypeptidase
VLLLVVLAPLFASGCGDEGGDDLPPPRPVVTTDRPTFDGEAALELARAQLDFGPRVPGTPGHAAQLAWMRARLDSLADTVSLHPFTHRHSETGAVLELTNVLARFRPESERRVLVLAHWDTRPTSDAAASPEERALPVPGANDGASGTAVILQLAAHLAADPPELGVDLLLVDGEDYGPTTDDMFLGAKHFAARLPKLSAEQRPAYGILLDMVGDADPRFPIEGYSAEYAPQLAQRIWSIAARLGYGRYFPMEVGQAIADDHLALNEAGLPTVDIIDFEYGPGNAYWHTPDDTADNLRAATLRMVGEVVMEFIWAGG